MTAFPLPLAELFGHYGSFAVYLLIGVLFGAVLETAGFGNSLKLAAQFYFKDLTVFKVMFTAIIVACTLVFLSSALGLLDYNDIVVHVQQAEERFHYALERLWRDCPIIELPEEVNRPRSATP